MSIQYTMYEAKSRFSELLRRVRAGERVVITYHGEPMAEIRPLEKAPESFEERDARLRREGRLIPARGPGDFRPLARRRGALQRFLAERD